LYSNDDPTGVELAGALKNVIAIAAGMCDGMGLGLNARAALITRGLAEIRRLGKPLGAKSETFLGLAGVGDLMLTCTATLSRNYRVGQGLAKGESLHSILSALGQVAEGVSTARALTSIAARAQVEMPICAGVLSVLEGHSSCAHAMTKLLERDPRSEAH
jgi:glycerol-3-phosphate dehydrogenase (NAD(P)+)